MKSFRMSDVEFAGPWRSSAVKSSFAKMKCCIGPPVDVSEDRKVLIGLERVATTGKRSME